MNYDHEHGPFGHYERKTMGHVLNTLSRIGVPMHVAEEVIFAGFDTEPIDSRTENIPKPMYLAILNHRGKPFAQYAYLDGFDEPLFKFTHLDIPSVFVSEVDKDGKKKYGLRPMLGTGNSVAIKSGDPQIVDMMRSVLDEIYREPEDHESYKLRVKALVVWSSHLLRAPQPTLELNLLRLPGAKNFLTYLEKRINGE